MAKVLGHSRAQSPSMVYLARCSFMLLHFPSPHSRLGSPRLRDLPTFHTPGRLQGLSRRCVHGCRAGDGNQDVADVIFGCRHLD